MAFEGVTKRSRFSRLRNPKANESKRETEETFLKVKFHETDGANGADDCAAPRRVAPYITTVMGVVAFVSEYVCSGRRREPR